MSSTEDKLIETFPNLKRTEFNITSCEDPSYNCIAWAANENDVWWWPDVMEQGYWPPDIPRIETIDAFIQAFSFKGYKQCSDPAFEEGFEKIAIYTDETGVPQHATRQIGPNFWTSKLGPFEDIQHDNLDGLNCKLYGRATVFMKRKKR